MGYREEVRERETGSPVIVVPDDISRMIEREGTLKGRRLA